jgi:hypothetical protein
LRISRRKRATKTVKNPTISRAKRSVATAGWAAESPEDGATLVLVLRFPWPPNATDPAMD